MSELTDLELLGALGVKMEPKKAKSYSPLEARLIAGFEDIVKFASENGRVPQHGEERDIFERLYAVRLDQLRKNPDAVALLADLDTHSLLTGDINHKTAEPTDEELLSALGVQANPDDKADITNITHVAPIAHRQAAEEIANREVCRDFDKFEPLFKQGCASSSTTGHKVKCSYGQCCDVPMTIRQRER